MVPLGKLLSQLPASGPTSTLTQLTANKPGLKSLGHCHSCWGPRWHSGLLAAVGIWQGQMEDSLPLPVSLPPSLSLFPCRSLHVAWMAAGWLRGLGLCHPVGDLEGTPSSQPGPGPVQPLKAFRASRQVGESPCLPRRNQGHSDGKPIPHQMSSCPEDLRASQVLPSAQDNPPAHRGHRGEARPSPRHLSRASTAEGDMAVPSHQPQGPPTQMGPHGTGKWLHALHSPCRATPPAPANTLSPRSGNATAQPSPQEHTGALHNPPPTGQIHPPRHSGG